MTTILTINGLLHSKFSKFELKNQNRSLEKIVQSKTEELKNVTNKLLKRNKELSCLYCISRIIEKQDINLDQMLQKIVNCIPEALQFPEIVCARLLIENTEYQTLNFTPTRWSYSRQIQSFNNNIGCIEIYYIEDIKEDKSELFKDEEIVLFEVVAERIGKLMERYHATYELTKSEEKYRTIFDHANDAIFIHDLGGKIIDSNKIASKWLGYDHATLKQMTASDILLTREKKLLLEITEALNKNGEISFEAELKTSYGNTIPIEANTTLVKYNDVQVVHTVARDITFRKFAEKEQINLRAQLKQAQKMEAIGTLAGGIAHDFNNILFPIYGFTQMTLEKLPENSTGRKNLMQVLKAADRAKKLVQQILTFSRQAIGEKKLLYPQIIIKEALKLLRASIPSTIQIMPMIEKTKPIMADATQLHQVIMNLCTNAYHAMFRQGGVLEIKLSELEIKKEIILPRSKMKPGKYIELIVKDSGHGMDKETIDKIFDPYFTTKDVGKGTGIGLSVVHGIINQHNGYITVKSKESEGSEFKVYIPVIDSDHENKKQKIYLNNIKGGGEHILLVDDEQMIVTLEKKILEHLGYVTTSCSSSKRALDLFKNAPNQFDLIILDMTMPEMTGAELANEILKIKDIPIILWTGYSEIIREEEAKAMGIREFIFKPVEKERLASIIRRVLDEENDKINIQ